MRIIYLKSTKQVVTVVDDDNSITAYPSDHCVIQAEPLTCIEMSLALGLEPEALLTFFADKLIDFPMTPAQEQLLKDRSFGITFSNEIIDQIKNQDTLTLTQRGSLLNKIHLFLTVLIISDLEAARAIFNSYPTDSILTQLRKDWVLGKIDAYIAKSQILNRINNPTK